jgi:hypothetical protein
MYDSTVVLLSHDEVETAAFLYGRMPGSTWAGKLGVN